MKVDFMDIVAILSVAFAIFVGIINVKRNSSSDDKQEASQMGAIMTTLANIDKGVVEIKREIEGVKSDVKEDRERIIKLEVEVRLLKERISPQRKDDDK